MTAYLVGLKNQSLTRDDEGHRNYTLTWHFRTDSYLDGPETVLQSVNALFPVGGAYFLDNDYDPWAFLTPDLSIAPHPDFKEGEPVSDWIIQHTYTTKPMWRCNTAQIENPLLEPYNISGDFIHVSREMKTDIDGLRLKHPNFEPIIGPEVEEKISYPQITISFNSATLPLSTFNLLINRVNDAPLWGLPKRCVKLTDVKWERVLYGVCFYYFKLSYTFETNPETFDKKIPAYGMKTLIPGMLPGFPWNYEYRKDATTKENKGPVFLDKDGNEATPETPLFNSNVYIQEVKLLKEGNLLLLGIPSTIP